MYNDLLEGKKIKDYVYIIEENNNIFVSTTYNQMNSQAIVEGFVCDIKKANNKEELEELKRQRNLMKKYQQNLNSLKKVSEYGKVRKKI